MVASFTPHARETPQTFHSASVRTVRLVAWGSASIFAALFATLSLVRHARLLTTGFDLGIFEQSVRSYAEGRPPTSLLKGVDYPLLGDHFSPIVALLGPIYAMFPGVEVLLIGQAMLLAVGVVPLVFWAARELRTTSTIVVALSYGLAGGLAHAAGFDFHEIAFAVPLLAFSLAALGQSSLCAAAAWAAPLVLVKEDLGITVVTIGVLIAVIGSTRAGRRVGVLTGGFGAVSTAVETLVFIPAVNPAGTNQYTHQLGVDTALIQATTFFSNDLKITTLVLLLLPTAFIALRSPLLFVALPTLAWRFLSDNPHYWGTAFHYDAVLVPIVTAAFIDGLVRLRRRHPNDQTSLQSALVVSLAATIALLSVSPLTQLLTPVMWQPSAHERVVRDILDQIPDGTTVAASNSLAPQLTSRAEVSMVGVVPPESDAPRFIVADTSIRHQYPMDARELAAFLRKAEGVEYEVVEARDGVVLLEKRHR